MSNRQLHPREERYRWAIEMLDEAFGQASVRITPRQHYHVITAVVFSPTGERSADLTLHSPGEDLNRQPQREKRLARWIAETRTQFAGTKPAAAGRKK